MKTHIADRLESERMRPEQLEAEIGRLERLLPKEHTDRVRRRLEKRLEIFQAELETRSLQSR